MAPETLFADLEGECTGSDPKDSSAANIVGRASRAKFLTEKIPGLDLVYNDIDSVGINVDASKAPKGLRCSEGITAKLLDCAERVDEACLLWENPDIWEWLQILSKGEGEGRQVELDKGKGKDKEKERDTSLENAHFGTADIHKLNVTLTSRESPENGSAGQESSIAKNCAGKERKRAE